MRIIKNKKQRERLNRLRSTVFSLILLSTVNNTSKVTRRWWVKPWLVKKSGNLNLVNEGFMNDSEQFKKFLRMDEKIFNILLKKIEPKIARQDTHFRSAISAKDKLIITLRFLATGESYRSLMYSFRVAESTISLFVPTICRYIYDCLKEEYLKVPTTTAEWLNISQEFEMSWNFPQTLGALDGKHVVFRAPRCAGSTYFNYKHTHSIVLLALVDAKYNFLYVDVGTNGRVSDGGVFRQSSLYAAMINNQLNFPEDRPLPGRNVPMPYVVVADAAFPLTAHILKPFPLRHMTEEQQYFNYRLSRARRVVENAFGILANRFRIFLAPINLNPDKVQIITLACCTLHNFLLRESPFYGKDNEEAHVFLYGLTRQAGNRPINNAINIRQEYANYVNNEGKL